MECPQCGSQNPEGKKYCGDCGAALDPAAHSIAAYLDSNLGPRVREILKEELRDRSVAEVEIAQAVATRISGWAKLLGFFVGIPLAALAVVLATLGISTYTDFKTKVAATRQDVEQKLKKADSEGDALLAEYGKLRTELARNRALAADVENLTVKVQQLETKIGIEPSADLDADLKKSLESAFSEFIAYLENLGFVHKGGPVRVQVRNNETRSSPNATYDPSQNRIEISPAFARDRQAIYNSYTLYMLSTLKTAETLELQPVQIGLSDYLTCSFSNNPRIGEIAIREARKVDPTYNNGKPYFRDLASYRQFPEQSRNPFDEGEVWGGAFWEIRKALGQAAADKLLFATWTSMELKEGKTGFVKRLLRLSHSIEGGRRAPEIRAIFERRGLKL